MEFIYTHVAINSYTYSFYKGSPVLICKNRTGILVQKFRIFTTALQMKLENNMPELISLQYKSCLPYPHSTKDLIIAIRHVNFLVTLEVESLFSLGCQYYDNCYQKIQQKSIKHPPYTWKKIHWQSRPL